MLNIGGLCSENQNDWGSLLNAGAKRLKCWGGALAPASPDISIFLESALLLWNVIFSQ